MTKQDGPNIDTLKDLMCMMPTLTLRLSGSCQVLSPCSSPSSLPWYTHNPYECVGPSVHCAADCGDRKGTSFRQSMEPAT